MNNLIELNTKNISSGSIREEGLGSSLFKRLSVLVLLKPTIKLELKTNTMEKAREIEAQCLEQDLLLQTKRGLENLIDMGYLNASEATNAIFKEIEEATDPNFATYTN